MAHETSPNLYSVSIKVLRTKTTKEIAESFNPLMILPAENGLLRDWRGLSELLHIDVSLVEKETNPTLKLLQLAAKDDQKYTIEILLSYFKVLERYDIIADYQELIDNDIREYCSVDNANTVNATRVCQIESYDAMVLYAEADVEFAYQVVDVMEKNYNLKLFVIDRDLKAGDKEVQATLSVIAEQSNKLIVVLSPHFLTSSTNEYFLDYAQTIGIEQQQRKIIPCMWSQCEMPKQLSGLHILKYAANNRWGNFWSKLADSIDPKCAKKGIAETELSTDPITLPDFCLDNQVNSTPLLAQCPAESKTKCQAQASPSISTACASTSYLQLDSCSSTISFKNSSHCIVDSSECRKRTPLEKMSSLCKVMKTKILSKRTKRKKSGKDAVAL